MKLYLALLIVMLILTTYLYVDLEYRWKNRTHVGVFISWEETPPPEERRRQKLEMCQEMVWASKTWYGWPTVFVDEEMLNR